MHPPAWPGPMKLSRRRLLQIGGASLFGLSLPRLLAADAKRRTSDRVRADACIIVFLNGGPSHLDMWEMKPEAPAEVRGPFKPIATTVHGVKLHPLSGRSTPPNEPMHLSGGARGLSWSHSSLSPAGR